MLLSRPQRIVWPLLLAWLAACGNEGGEGSEGPTDEPMGPGPAPENTDIPGGLTGIPSDTAVVEMLAEGLNFATAVAVREGGAWVTEAQLDHLLQPAQSGPPDPFRIVGVSLKGRLTRQVISFLTPRPNLYPEGIAAAADGTLYFGSAGERLIFSVAPGSLEPGGFLIDNTVFGRGVVGLHVDEARGLVWACDSNRALGGPTAVLALSRADASVRARHAMPDDTFCGDVVVDAQGNVLVTESLGGALYRSPAAEAVTTGQDLELVAEFNVLRPSNGYSPKGIEVLGGGVIIVTNSEAGLLYRLDADGVEPVRATLGGQPYPFTRPDGLTRLAERELLVVENGDGGPNPSRLVKVTFDPR